MKFIIAGMILTGMLIGCSTPRSYTTMTEQIGNYGLERYTDKQKGVDCYVYSDKDNIALSCVKTKTENKQ